MALDAPPDPRVRVYAPLAVGGHVDHRHGFTVGADLARAGWDVWFYEDLPYAINEGALPARLTALATTVPVEPAASVPVESSWTAKLTAILAYPSQLATVFGYVGAGSSRDEIDRVMRAYATRDGDVPTERYWRRAGAAARPVERRLTVGRQD